MHVFLATKALSHKENKTSWLNAIILICHQSKIYLLFGEVDVFNLDAYFVAQLVGLLFTLTDDGVVLFVERLKIVGYIAQAYHAFAFVLDNLYIHTPFGNARNDAAVGIANLLFQVLSLFVFNRSAFGIGSLFFHLRAVQAKRLVMLCIS